MGCSAASSMLPGEGVGGGLEEEAMPDSQTRCSKTPGVDGKAWMEFGLELERLNLSAGEEATLDPQAAAALASARPMGQTHLNDEGAKGPMGRSHLNDEGREGPMRGSCFNDEGGEFPVGRPHLDDERWVLSDTQSSVPRMSEEEKPVESIGKHVRDLFLPGASLGGDSAPPMEKEASPGAHHKLQKPSSTWVEWGLELAGVGMTIEEEASLDALSRASLQAARVLLSRGKSNKDGLDFEPQSPVDARSSGKGTVARSEHQAGVRSFQQCGSGADDLSFPREACEDPHKTSANVLESFISQMSEVEMPVESRERSVDSTGRRVSQPFRPSAPLGDDSAPPMEKEASPGAHHKLQKLSSKRLEWGLELAGAGLSGEEEASLDALSRSSLRAARVLLSRGKSNEDGLGFEPPSPVDAHSSGKGAVARSEHQAGGCGFHQCGSRGADDLTTSHEARVDPHKTSSKVSESFISRMSDGEMPVESRERSVESTGRRVHQPFPPGAPLGGESAPPMEKEASPGGHHKLQKSSSWFGWGLEVAGAGLSRALSRASLLASRVLPSRENSCEDGLGVESQSHVDAHSSKKGAVARSEHQAGECGLQQCGSGADDLTATQEARVDPHKTSAIMSASFDSRTNEEKIPAECSERSVESTGRRVRPAFRPAAPLGGESAPPMEKEASPGAPHNLQKLSSSWLEWGLEVAGAGLSGEEEASLDALSRASLRAARGLLARENSCDDGLGPGPQSNVDAHSSGKGAMARSEHQTDGCGFQRCGSGADDFTTSHEVCVDPHKTSAIMSESFDSRIREVEMPVESIERPVESIMRLVRPRFRPGASFGGDCAPSMEKEAAPGAQHKPRKTSSAWLEWGAEVAGVGLSGEEEASLDALSRASLRAARVLLSREMANEDDFTATHEACVDPHKTSAKVSESFDSRISEGGEMPVESRERSVDSTERRLHQPFPPGASLGGESAFPLEKEAAPGAQHKPRKPYSKWMESCVEVAGVGMTGEKEASLDAVSRASLQAARVRGKSYEDGLDFEPQSNVDDHRSGKGADVVSKQQGGVCGFHRCGSGADDSSFSREACADPHKTSCKVCESSNSQMSEVEMPVESRERSVESTGRRVRPAFLPCALLEGDSPPSVEDDVSPGAQHKPRKPSSKWMESSAAGAGVGMAGEEEASLDALSRASLQAARVLLSRENSCEDGHGFGPHSPVDAHRSGKRAVVRSEHQAGVCGFQRTGSGADDLSFSSEACVDPHKTSSKVSESFDSRMSDGEIPVESRERSFEITGRRLRPPFRPGASLEGDSAPPLEKEASAAAHQNLEAIDSAWLEWGLEVAKLRLSDEQEASLDAISKASLRAARMLLSREKSCVLDSESQAPVDAHRTQKGSIARSEHEADVCDFQRSGYDLTAPQEAWVDPNMKLRRRDACDDLLQLIESLEDTSEKEFPPHMGEDALSLPCEGELTVSQHRSWLEIGMDLLSLELSPEEESKLHDQAKASLLLARILDGSGAVSNPQGVADPQGVAHLQGEADTRREGGRGGEGGGVEGRGARRGGERLSVFAKIKRLSFSALSRLSSWGREDGGCGGESDKGEGAAGRDARMDSGAEARQAAASFEALVRGEREVKDGGLLAGDSWDDKERGEGGPDRGPHLVLHKRQSREVLSLRERGQGSHAEVKQGPASANPHREAKDTGHLANMSRASSGCTSPPQMRNDVVNSLRGWLLHEESASMGQPLTSSRQKQHNSPASSVASQEAQSQPLERNCCQEQGIEIARDKLTASLLYSSSQNAPPACASHDSGMERRGRTMINRASTKAAASEAEAGDLLLEVQVTGNEGSADGLLLRQRESLATDAILQGQSTSSMRSTSANWPTFESGSMPLSQDHQHLRATEARAARAVEESESEPARCRLEGPAVNSPLSLVSTPIPPDDTAVEDVASAQVHASSPLGSDANHNTPVSRSLHSSRGFHVGSESLSIKSSSFNSSFSDCDPSLVEPVPPISHAFSALHLAKEALRSSMRAESQNSAVSEVVSTLFSAPAGDASSGWSEDHLNSLPTQERERLTTCVAEVRRELGEIESWSEGKRYAMLGRLEEVTARLESQEGIDDNPSSTGLHAAKSLLVEREQGMDGGMLVALGLLEISQSVLQKEEVGAQLTRQGSGVELCLRALSLAKDLICLTPVQAKRQLSQDSSYAPLDIFDEGEEAALISFARRARGAAARPPKDHLHFLCSSLPFDLIKPPISSPSSPPSPLPPHLPLLSLLTPSPLPLSPNLPLPEQGVLLNKLVLHVQPDALDPRALNLPEGSQPLTKEARVQNHTLCANAATSIGCGVREMHPAQLAHANAHRQIVLSLLFNLARRCHLSPVVGRRGGKRVDAQLERGAQKSPEAFLISWINERIAQFGSPSQKLIRIDFRIANLGSDLTDSVALGIVEHQIAPEREFELRVLRSPDLHKRAAYVLEVANRLGVDGLHLRPEDITRPRPRLLLLLVSSLYALGSHHASDHDARIFANKRAPAEREANTYRMWMVSLGVNVGDLFEDCKCGLPLLLVESFLQPSCVEWRRVHRYPKSIFQCMENCEQACEVAAGPLKLPIRGIGGKDLADGNEKLILAILFQLMSMFCLPKSQKHKHYCSLIHRWAHVLQMLCQLGVCDEGGEERIIKWANARIISKADCPEEINSFSDRKLRSGTWLLQLLHAIAPESVDPKQILEATTPEQRKLNAIYAISCAHKMGCTVFVTWEDLVQVRNKEQKEMCGAEGGDQYRHDFLDQVEPKMMMLVFAAAMAEDIRRERGERSVVLSRGDSSYPATFERALN
ncbi:MAG: hypothetical protein SGPRY_002196 [Prymnesium sp.]